MTALLGENAHMWLTFAIIASAMVLFMLDRIPMELSSALTVLALLVLFYFAPLPDRPHAPKLDSEALLSGFANPVVFTILSLLIVGQGLFQTGAIEKATEIIAGIVKLAPVTAIAMTLGIAGIISAFLNNTPVVVMFIPILSAVATRIGQTPAHVLMPLSFITILGGMTTLIGSSANLIATTVAEASGVAKIGFFDFAVPGVFLASLGAIYVFLIVPRLIKPSPALTQGRSERGKQFISEFELVAGHPWIGMQSTAGIFPELKGMTVRLIQREADSLLPPFDGVVLREGDHLMIAATRRDLLGAIAKDRNVIAGLHAEINGADEDETGEEAGRSRLIMTEAVIAPGSQRIGGRLNPDRFRLATGCTLLGIERRSQMVRGPLNEISLVAGDVLLLLGTPHAVRGLRDHRDLLLLARSRAELPVTHHTRRAMLIFALMIVLAASGVVPIVIAAMAGAAAMIASGALTLNQATRALDSKIFFLVGAAFAMATAMEATGGAAALAHLVVGAFSPWGPAVLLSAMFLLTAILTNFLTNHATAALVAPIVVSAAAEIGANPEPFVYGLIFALNCSFATPIAYQTNLIVMGPGHYRFKDFAIAGIPLILIIWIAYSVFAPLYFGI